MNFIYEILNLDEVYMNTLKSNGIHAISFVKNRNTYEIVKWEFYNSLNTYEKRNYKIFTHLGLKHEIKDDLWCMSMTTSQRIIEINSISIQNIELTNNFHKFMNQPIIAHNSILSQYFKFDENIYSYPEYCKQYIKIGNMVENTLEIQKDLIKGYNLSLYKANFNEPYIMSDYIFNYYKLNTPFYSDNNEVLKYQKSEDYLNFRGISPSNLIQFTENALNGKNVKGEDLIKKEKIETLVKDYIKYLSKNIKK